MTNCHNSQIAAFTTIRWASASFHCGPDVVDGVADDIGGAFLALGSLWAWDYFTTMLDVPQAKFITFREERYWRGSKPIVGFAPKITVRALVSNEEMAAIFGGHLEYEDRTSGERYLGVWGARKANRFLRLLRKRGGVIALENGEPDQYHQRHRASR
jgi:hypothetical protein